ncbi:hypothetical protein THRCLA_04050 [Thraustotheca clavata]|uniref:Uncharacterized protein n=1 Tax=Thraustotheca clavata TaxID=74557 RepID=A0A1W0A0T4_9STRA|nr:hypothetical protein THRCLA_04050 [Thraustotheca clavata]
MSSRPVSLQEIMDETFAQSLAQTPNDLPEGYNPSDYEHTIPGYDPRDFEDDIIPGYDPRDFEVGAYDVDTLTNDVDYALALSLQEEENVQAEESLIATEAASSDYEYDGDDDESGNQTGLDYVLAPKDTTKPKRRKKVGARMQKDPRRAYSEAKLARLPRQILVIKAVEEDIETITTFLSTLKCSLKIATNGPEYFRSAPIVENDQLLLYVIGTEADMQILLGYLMSQVDNAVILAVKDLLAAPEPLTKSNTLSSSLMLKLLLHHHTKVGVLLIAAAYVWEYPRIMLVQYFLGLLVDYLQSNNYRSATIGLHFGLLTTSLSLIREDYRSEQPHLWKYVIPTPMTVYGGNFRLAGVPVYSLLVAIWEATMALQATTGSKYYQRLHDAYVLKLQAGGVDNSVSFSAFAATGLSSFHDSFHGYGELVSYSKFSAKVLLALFFCVLFCVATFCNSPGLEGEHLRDAVRNCDVDSAKKALSRGTNPNSKGHDKGAALHICAQQALADMARILLEAGADVNVSDGFGFTPLHWAVQLRREETCIEKRLEIIRVLLEYGGNINIVNYNGISPAMIAARPENLRANEIIQLYGCEVD